MDTRVTKASVCADHREAAPAFVPLALAWSCCGVLVLLLCGCEFMKPSPSRTGVAAADGCQPAKTESMVPKSGTSVRTNQAATGTTSTKNALPAGQAQPQPWRTAKLNTPSAQPAKGAERLIALTPAASRSPTAESSLATSKANASVTTMSLSSSAAPQPVGTELIFKGPPRAKYSASKVKATLLWSALGFLGLIVVLILCRTLGSRLPGTRPKARRDELITPSGFKVKDSVIDGRSATSTMGMLVRQAPRRSSILQCLMASCALLISNVVALCAGLVSSWKARGEKSSELPSDGPPASKALNSAGESLGTGPRSSMLSSRLSATPRPAPPVPPSAASKPRYLNSLPDPQPSFSTPAQNPHSVSSAN